MALVQLLLGLDQPDIGVLLFVGLEIVFLFGIGEMPVQGGVAEHPAR